MLNKNLCDKCGKEFSENDKFCQNCGTSLNKKDLDNNLDYTNLNKKSERNYKTDSYIMNEDILEKINTGLATVFSGIVLGLGQLYNGDFTKGIILFISGGVLIGIILFFNTLALIAPYYVNPSGFFILSGFAAIIYLFIWIYNIKDANKNSKIRNS